MVKEAVNKYKELAQELKSAQKYDDLLQVYELILPHQPTNLSMIKDVCILYLRRREPDNAIRTIQRYKVETEPQFSQLYDKAKLLKEALRKK